MPGVPAKTMIPSLSPPLPATGPRALFAKAIRILLIGSGATLTVSAVINLVAAWQLIDAAEEQSLGIIRQEILGWYTGALVAGLLLIYLGLLRGRK